MEQNQHGISPTLKLSQIPHSISKTLRTNSPSVLSAAIDTSSYAWILNTEKNSIQLWKVGSAEVYPEYNDVRTSEDFVCVLIVEKRVFGFILTNGLLHCWLITQPKSSLSSKLPLNPSEVPTCLKKISTSAVVIGTNHGRLFLVNLEMSNNAPHFSVKLIEQKSNEGRGWSLSLSKLWRGSQVSNPSNPIIFIEYNNQGILFSLSPTNMYVWNIIEDSLLIDWPIQQKLNQKLGSVEVLKITIFCGKLCILAYNDDDSTTPVYYIIYVDVSHINSKIEPTIDNIHKVPVNFALSSRPDEMKLIAVEDIIFLVWVNGILCFHKSDIINPLGYILFTDANDLIRGCGVAQNKPLFLNQKGLLEFSISSKVEGGVGGGGGASVSAGGKSNEANNLQNVANMLNDKPQNVPLYIMSNVLLGQLLELKRSKLHDYLASLNKTKLSDEFRIKILEQTEKFYSSFRTHQIIHMLENPNSKLFVRNVVSKSLDKRNEPKIEGIDDIGLYFVKVLLIEDVCEYLFIDQPILDENNITFLLEINALVEKILDVSFCHEQVAIYEVFDLDDVSLSTSWRNKPSTRNCLKKQIQQTNAVIKSYANNRNEMYYALLTQYYKLNDILLSTYLQETLTSKSTVALEEMIHIASQAAKTFTSSPEFYQQALLLAEKYYDYNTIITICEEQNNTPALYGYMEKFLMRDDRKDLFILTLKPFGRALFDWYRSRGEYKKLMSLPDIYNKELDEYLSPIESEKDIAWIHKIRLYDYSQCYEILNGLSQDVSKNIDQQRINLSLAKLSYLSLDSAGYDDVPIVQLDARLNHIRHQDTLKTYESTEQLIKQLTDKVEDDSEAYYILLRSFALFADTLPLREPSDSVNLITWVWLRVIGLNCKLWQQLASEFESKIATLEQVKNCLYQSYFYQVATHPQVGPYLDINIYKRLIASLKDENDPMKDWNNQSTNQLKELVVTNSNAKRLIDTTFFLIMEHKNKQ
eukprot:TRINITY_DN1415_c0_g1_i1.p1 TRINITY_DN1415_c0_g1~~TRINITY_DN1415_c0_g1_i1.p1  ORF type:complete len:979 (+),score=220.66 TRINITY_DN1415_c0_g1_i1:1-2937(+)